MTYGEMRNLAREKFGLELTDGYLPGGTLQQACDRCHRSHLRHRAAPSHAAAGV